MRQFDIILMDVHMPQLDGMEATRRIRSLSRYRDTPIIALTADAFSADQSREGGGVTMKDAAGLVSWRGGQGGFLSLIGTDTREKDLTGDVVSIAIDGDGKAWAGTYQGVVTELTEKFPLMDAVVNRQVAAQGQVWEQPAWDGAAGSGWVAARWRQNTA